MIKPLYGLLTDFIPLFGYRRKSYLLLMAGLAVAGSGSPSPSKRWYAPWP
jgi:hypothetical protein